MPEVGNASRWRPPSPGAQPRPDRQARVPDGPRRHPRPRSTPVAATERAILNDTARRPSRYLRPCRYRCRQKSARKNYPRLTCHRANRKASIRTRQGPTPPVTPHAILIVVSIRYRPPWRPPSPNASDLRARSRTLCEKIAAKRQRTEACSIFLPSSGGLCWTRVAVFVDALHPTSAVSRDLTSCLDARAHRKRCVLELQNAKLGTAVGNWVTNFILIG